MSGEPPTVSTCDLCGRTESNAAVLLTWTTAVERGRPHRCCGPCARGHLRAMEARLDPEHW